MSSDEEKLKHSIRRRNKVRKDMLSNDMRGAFAIKAIDPRRPEYHREKLRVTDIYEDTDES